MGGGDGEGLPPEAPAHARGGGAEDHFLELSFVQDRLGVDVARVACGNADIGDIRSKEEESEGNQSCYSDDGERC